MRILVVDDSPSIVDLIEDFLKRKGIRGVERAYNSDDALRKIESEIYDVYIFDYHLPSKSGVELARIAKKKGGKKILIITGDKGLKTDEFPVVYKPFGMEEIWKRISR